MVTQLRQTRHARARAGAVVFGELPRCDEPGGRADGARGDGRPVRRLSRPGAVRLSVRAHDRARRDAAVRRRVRAWSPIARPRLVIEEAAVAVTTRVHLIGICGTAMATLAAMLKQQGLRRPRLRPERLSADERLPRGRGHSRRSSGYRAEHITGDLDLVVVGNAISRGNPELEEVLDRKIRYCSLPEAIREHFLWGARSIVIAGTHGKTTTTSLTGWLLTHGGVDPSVLVGGIARNFGEHGFELSHRAGPRLRHRGRRVRQRVLRQDREVPEVPARHRGRQQHRVRPRGHLRRPRRGDAGVPAAREPRAAARAAAARRRQRRRAAR